MKTKEFHYLSKDGVKISAVCWTADEGNPVGVVQIVHGMAEHKNRYSGVAGALVKEGFVVYANDHRGHGATAEPSGLGHLADENGWEKSVEDVWLPTQVIRRDYQGLPVFLLGHSMGSLIARDYIIKHNDLRGAVLTGTSGPVGVLGPIGLFIAKREATKKGKRTLSPKLDKLSFGNFNKKFSPNRTAFDWLSRDRAEVDKYVADPLCGFVCTAQFYQDLVTGTVKVNKKANIATMDKELPVLLLSGGKDPVGKNATGVLKVYSRIKKAGLKDVKIKIYKEARHEIFNETNRNEVFRDLIDWLKQHL